jgi:hypothetical protein
MHKQFVYTGGRWFFRALMPAVFSAMFSSHALAADLSQALDPWIGAMPVSPITNKCVHPYNLPCVVPYQASPYHYPTANNEPEDYRYGLNLGDYGPVRVKFTGTKLKLRWLF